MTITTGRGNIRSLQRQAASIEFQFAEREKTERGDAVATLRLRPSYGDGLHSVTAIGTGGRKAITTRIWNMAGSTLRKAIRGRRMREAQSFMRGMHK